MADSAGNGAIWALRLQGLRFGKPRGEELLPLAPEVGSCSPATPQLPQGQCLTLAHGGTEPFAPDKSLHS